MGNLMYDVHMYRAGQYEPWYIETGLSLRCAIHAFFDEKWLMEPGDMFKIAIQGTSNPCVIIQCTNTGFKRTV